MGKRMYKPSGNKVESFPIPCVAKIKDEWNQETEIILTKVINNKDSKLMVFRRLDQDDVKEHFVYSIKSLKWLELM